MASCHDIHVALVLLGGLLLDAVDDAPDIAGQRCLDDLGVYLLGLLRDDRGLQHGRRLVRRCGLLHHRCRCLRHGGSHALNGRAGCRRGDGCRRCVGCADPGALRSDRHLPVGRRIRLAEVRPANLDGMLGRRNEFHRLLVMVEECIEIQRDTVGGQRRKSAMPAAQTIGLRVVERHREVRRVAQDLSDQAGQHPARTDFDEASDPITGHRLDHLAEPHHLLNLIAELHGDVLAVDLRGGVCVDREVGLPDLQRLQVRRERSTARGHDLGVERRGHWKANGRPALGFCRGLRPRDIRLVTGQHHLGRRIVVGDHQRPGLRRRGQQRPDLVGRRRHGQHRAVLALAGFVHQRAASTGRLDQALGRQHARGGQRGDLTEAVACCRVGAHPEQVEQRELSQAGRSDGRLRVGHRGEFLLLGVGRLGIEHRFREHHPGEIGEIALEPVPDRERFGEGECEVAAHPDVLAALSGEQVRRLALARRAEADRDIGVLERCGGAVGKRSAQPVCRRRERFDIGRDQPSAGMLRGVERFGGVERDAGQAFPGAGSCGDVGGPLLQISGRRRAEHHEFAGQGPQPLGPMLALVFLERHMEVAAAEAERTDRGTSGLVPLANPGPGLRVDVERRVLQSQRRIRTIYLQRSRQGRMLQRKNGLDEAGGTCRGLRVTDLGFHRAQRNPRRGVGEHRLQSGELGDVTRFGRGAVRLDQFDRRGVVAGALVRAAQRLGLSLGTGGVHAGGTPVGRRPQPADDRVDLVAVAFGVGEPLERQHADTFADDGAVGAVGERAAVTGRRERRCLREAHVHHHVVECVDAAGQHHIGLVQIQPVQCRLQRRKRTRAGGVGDEVGTAQVQSVGDPPGDDVAEQAREGALLPRHVVIGDVLADLVCLGLRQAVLQQGFPPDRPLHPRTHLDHEFGRRGHPEYHVHSVEVDLRAGPLHLVEQPSGGDQGENLSGVCRR